MSTAHQKSDWDAWGGKGALCPWIEFVLRYPKNGKKKEERTRLFFFFVNGYNDRLLLKLRTNQDNKRILLLETKKYWPK